MGDNMLKYKPALDESNSTLQQLYNDIKLTCNIEKLPNWAVYLGNNPQHLQAIWNFLQTITRNCSLSPLLQELIIFSVSYKSGSAYCAEFHASEAIKLNSALDFEQLREIVSGESNGILPRRYIEAIRFAVKHSKSNCNIGEEETCEIILKGFDLESVQEIFSLCALASAFNNFTKGMNIPIDESHRVENFCIDVDD